MNRRDFSLGTVAIGLSCSSTNADAHAAEQLQTAEKLLPARIGVYTQNLKTRQVFQHRSNERFAMCSTFKTQLAALCLHRADQGQLDLKKQLSFNATDLVPASPVTTQHVSEGALTIASLCAAAVEYSDNTAANLLLTHIGGPDAMTRFFREIGDRTSRLDRMEPALNSNTPGDDRDTTTPRAMADNLYRLIVGTNHLTASSRDQLVQWMRNEQNGKNRIRAAVPDDWIVANKPGTSLTGAVNDTAVLWSPTGVSYVLTVYVDTQKEQTSAAMTSMKDIASAALREIL